MYWKGYFYCRCLFFCFSYIIAKVCQNLCQLSEWEKRRRIGRFFCEKKCSAKVKYFCLFFIGRQSVFYRMNFGESAQEKRLPLLHTGNKRKWRRKWYLQAIFWRQKEMKQEQKKSKQIKKIDWLFAKFIVYYIWQKWKI